MTGRELIMYVLQNNLEDVKITNGDWLNFESLGFLNEEEAAEKFNVGTATIAVWYATGVIPGIKTTKGVYIPKDVKDPRRRD